MANEDHFTRALCLEEEAAEWEATADLIDQFERRGKRVHYALRGTSEARRNWATMLRKEAERRLAQALA